MIKYGWRKDLPDPRDYVFKTSIFARLTLPSSVDLREHCSEVEDQKDLGSCTGNAIAGAIELLEKKDGKTLEQISRLFIYYNERDMEGTITEDAGGSLRDGIKSLTTLGACSETLWPYDISQFTIKPSDACYADAQQHKVTKYERLNTLTDMKTCLSKGFPFVLGITLYDSFESDTVAATGIVPMPTATESCLGGHAVLCVGYHNATNYFTIRNSWGNQWGDKGYFYLPFTYVQKFGSDFWAIYQETGF